LNIPKAVEAARRLGGQAAQPPMTAATQARPSMPVREDESLELEPDDPLPRSIDADTAWPQTWVEDAAVGEGLDETAEVGEPEVEPYAELDVALSQPEPATGHCSCGCGHCQSARSHTSAETETGEASESYADAVREILDETDEPLAPYAWDDIREALEAVDGD
jgi:hypothetical protein